MRIVPRESQERSTEMNLNVVWSAPESQLQLNKNEVHVWRASIDVNPRFQAVLACFLDSDERRRASQFVFGRDRNHFVAAHGILRQILGGYLQRSPEELRFTLGRHGKPALRNETGCADVRFNLFNASGRETSFSPVRSKKRSRSFLAKPESASVLFSSTEAAKRQLTSRARSSNLPDNNRSARSSSRSSAQAVR